MFLIYHHLEVLTMNICSRVGPSSSLWLHVILCKVCSCLRFFFFSIIHVVHSFTCTVTPSGVSRTPPYQLPDSGVYPSTFHATPERRKFSKDAWEKFTKDSTQRAVQELVSSPDFSKWVAANAERITVTPKSSGASGQQRRKWLLWS